MPRPQNKNRPHPHFRVYRKALYGDAGKRVYFKEEFEKRKQARNFCNNRMYEEGLTIVHPDGTREPYEANQYKDGQYVGLGA